MVNNAGKLGQHCKKLKSAIELFVAGLNGNISIKFWVHDWQLARKFYWRHCIHYLKLTHQVMKLI